MPLNLAELLRQLSQAPDQDEAARALLAWLLAALGRCLPPEATPLRALCHLRGSEGYQALLVVDRGPPQAEAAWGPSLTAWQALERFQEGVDADVETGDFGTASGRAWLEDPDPDTEGFADTSVRLKARDATHLLALPLRLRGKMLGMVTLELSAPELAGARLPLWPSPGQDLQLACDACAPYFGALPEPDAAPVGDLAFAGPALRQILRRLATFAMLDGPVLLVGETGTGKTHLARWIHERSSRAAGPFVCADLHSCADEHVEAQLFGVAKGAFTSVNERPGRAEDASGGTLFIDELDSLSFRAQTALLTLLAERRFRRLGDTREQTSNFRVIAGAGARLPALVADGRFRQDLYRRLEITPFLLPPLRARPEEIEGWCDLLLRHHHASAGGSGAPRLAAEAVVRLKRQAWPGNLRELDAVLYRAYGLALAGRRPDDPRPVHIDLRAVEEALAMGLLALADPHAMLGEALGGAANALLNVIDRLPPDQAELKALGASFAGAIVSEALSRSQDPKEAAALLRRSTRGGQHLEAFRTYGKHLAELLRSLGEPLPTALSRILDDTT